MPGPAFHFEVLNLAIKSLSAESAADRAKAKLLTDHPNHARLGALGPDFLRYRPVATAALDTIISAAGDLSTLSPADRTTLAKQVEPNPEMALYGVLYRVLVPHFADMQAIDDLLSKVAGIAAAEDVEGLKNVKGEVDQLKPKVDALKGLVDQSKPISAAGQLAVVLGKPQIEGDKPALPQLWRPFEFLRWKRTAEFGRNLLGQANAQNDDELRAYAHGYLSHLASAVIGEPFVNSIVGGPYRTHWWRNKWVRNYIDAWTFGRYATPGTMAGDIPTPDYASWHSLCGTDLQDQFKVDGGLAGPDAATAVQSGVIPPTPNFDKVGNALIAAATQTFGSVPGPAIAPPPTLEDLSSLRAAYIGVISVLWFMTGKIPLCPPPPGAPPKGAETPPAWFTSGGSPPSPSAGSAGGGSSSSSTASGAIAAILAVIAVLTGNVIVGVAALVFAIAAAISAADSGNPVDWDGLRSTIYWLQVLMFQAEDGIHKALVKGGVAYPLGRELGTPPSGIFPFLPASDQTAVALTKSRRVADYPLRMDDRGMSAPADATYVQSPASSGEAPGTRMAFDLLAYPDAMIDGTGILNGGVATDTGVFPTRDQDFGGAAANAVAVIQTDAATLANYNLDGDRGYGWKTWKPKPGTKPGDPSTDVSPVEER